MGCCQPAAGGAERWGGGGKGLRVRGEKASPSRSMAVSHIVAATLGSSPPQFSGIAFASWARGMTAQAECVERARRCLSGRGGRKRE